ncbi:restin homolog [Clytia hemisphaerica]|uniref:Uncharacterized protein n=1 Tax=Clytia hemisphaerica TaxID=252671 RepID=A0A7M6DLK1_9CNID
MDFESGNIASKYCNNEMVITMELSQLRHENKELYMARKFYEYQYEECRQDKESLINELTLLENVLQQTLTKSEEQHTRLVERYESQFERLRFECQHERNKYKPLENRIQDLKQREKQLLEQLACKETLVEQKQQFLNDSHDKVGQLESELTDVKKKLADQKTQNIWLSEKVDSTFKQKEESDSLFQGQLEDLRLVLVEKELECHTKGERVGELRTLLEDECKKSRFLYDSVKKVDEVTNYHKTLLQKYEDVKRRELTASRKLKESQREKKKLTRRVKEQKQESLGRSSESEDEINSLKKESQRLKKKLKERQDSHLKASSDWSKEKQGLESRMDALEEDNQQLKSEKSSISSEITLLKESLKKIEDEKRSGEIESEQKLKELHNEVDRLRKEANEKQLHFEAKTTILVSHQQTDNAKTVSDTYEDDFEPSSDEDESIIQEKSVVDEMSQKEKVVELPEDTTRDICSLKEELAPCNQDIVRNITSVQEEVPSLKGEKHQETEEANYDNDTFEDCQSSASSVASIQDECTTEIDDGELLDESVADIESDVEDSIKSGVFFGDEAKPSRDSKIIEAPNQTSSVVVPVVAEIEKCVGVKAVDTQTHKVDNNMASDLKGAHFEASPVATIKTSKSKPKVFTVNDLFGAKSQATAKPKETADDEHLCKLSYQQNKTI